MLAVLRVIQFESFSQYRAKLANKTDAEMTELETNPRLWNVHIVLNVLHSLIDKSNINEQLEAFKNGDNPNDVAGSFGQKTLYKMLGYFSLVGLLRLHCLLGASLAFALLPSLPLCGLHPNCPIPIFSAFLGRATCGMRKKYFTVCLSIPKQMLHDVNFQT